MRDELQGAIGEDLWNATGGTNQNCIAAYTGEEWKCFFVQYLFPFLDDSRLRFFIAQSQADSWQVENLLVLGIFFAC